MEIKLENFSKRMKELRKEKGLKQKEMAALLECTERHYQKIEYGQINLPTLDLMFLADYVAVSMDYLVGRTDVREVNR